MKQIKRVMKSIFACILVMSLSLTGIPHSEIVMKARAESVKSGTIGEGITWQYSADGTLTISGNGSMPDYTTVNNYYTGITTDVPWGDYLSNITKVVINGNVDNIGKCAFSDCTSIKQVIFSSSIKKIGEAAFARCTGLNSISFPNALDSIGKDAFRGCTGITNVIVPDSVTAIESGAFQACTNLTDIHLGKNISSIKSYTFTSCTRLVNIEIPQNITSIGIYAFSLCSALLEVEIPISVKSISDEAFSSCSSLKKVTVNNESLYFGQSVFKNCSSNFVMYGKSGSTSETYAEKNAHAFVAMNTENDSLQITSFVIDKELGTTVGEYVRLEAVITGGTGEYSTTFSYVVNGIETVLSKDTLLSYALFMPTEEGTYDFIVSVKDSDGDVVIKKIEGYLISKKDGDDDVHLFNEYTYRADHLIDTSEVEGTTMENGYINADTPSEILLKELQKNGFSYTADAWRAVTRTCDAASDASNILDYTVEEKDIYEAIILNALESAAKYDVIDTINADVVKDTNELLQIIKADLKVNYSITIYDSTQNTTLTEEMRTRTKKVVEEYYDQKNISKAAKWLDTFEDVMEHLDTIEDFCEELSSYINIRNMNDSMKLVLKEMKKNCPSDNKALASALDDCVNILDASDSEFEKQMIAGGLKTVGAEAAKAGISKFWDKVVVTKIETLCPRVVIIKAAYKTSKYLTNLVFNTDEITEKYYKMIAVTEFDSLIRDTYSSLKSTYVNGKNIENAKAYLNSIDVMFNAISSDCDSAYAYVDSVDSANLSKICKLFGCSSNSASLKASIESIKRSNNLEYEGILVGWVNYLQEDFPEEYPHYTGLLEESNNRIKEYQIHCPVDIYVYDSENRLAASVINNIPSSSELTVVVDGDEKTLYLPEDEQYFISYIGNGTGAMDIEVAEIDADGTITRRVNFNNIPLSKGVEYSSKENGKFSEEAEYSIADSNGQDQKTDFDSYPQENSEKHTITIEQGTIFNDGMPFYAIEVCENQVLDISAYVPVGYEFDKWKVSSGNIEIKDESNVNTKIVVGSEDAVITAILKDNQSSDTPKPIDPPDSIQTSKPTDSVNTAKSPGKGTILKDKKNKVSYKVTAKGKTVTFYKVNNKKAKKIIVPAAVTISGIKYKVTAISDNAFNGCKKLKSVTIGKHVTAIGSKAFYKCVSLKKITIPSSVVKIGKKAFYGCKKLKSITIKTKKLKSKTVGTQAFKGINKKAVITVPKKQKKAYKKWLKKKGMAKTVKIK